jgi:predicted RNA binding protein YcfA (HicA-like mRNA interferase family)
VNTGRLAGLNGRQIVRALQRGGFDIVRVSGSHHVMRKPGVPSSKVVVPVHGSKAIPVGTVRSIVKQSGLTIEEFSALL